MPTAAPAKVSRADRFRQMAEKLADDIRYKRESGVAAQRMTRRRAAMAESARRDADRMDKVRQALVGLADASEAGTLVSGLAGVSNKQQVADLLTNESFPQGTYCQDTRDRLDKAGIDETNFAAAQSALLFLMPGADPESERRAKVAAMERALIGRKIPGFFPTPPALVARLIELADIRPGMSVLEPSAGKGDIAEQIRHHAGGYEGGCKLDVIEINPDLCAILEAKGFGRVGNDFLEFNGEGRDRILMNPPFEKGQDIDHVRHAYGLLNPGGRLVSVMSTAPFSNNRRKEQEFRQWFDLVGGERHDVAAGAFALGDKATGINTGVSTVVVVIDRK